MTDNLKLKTENSKLVCIVGPTGVGKSDIAFKLAQEIGADILSCDAFQVYVGLPVGTNQPTSEMLDKVKHHFVGVRDPKEPWSAADFAMEAESVLEKSEKEGRTVLVVGGSGFYLRALLEGVPHGDSPTPEQRHWVKSEVERRGEGAHAWLREIDPAAAERLHPNDVRRITRALEKSLYPSGVPEHRTVRPKTARVFGLEIPREKLDAKLLARTHVLWAGGLLTETRALLEREVPREAAVWGAIGYAEAADFLEGRISETDAKERVYRRTRQYAKRQWTWFRHHHGTQWLNIDVPDPSSHVLEALKALIQTKGNTT